MESGHAGGNKLHKSVTANNKLTFLTILTWFIVTEQSVWHSWSLQNQS